MSQFPSILKDCLWHSTSFERYQNILISGAILPEPPIPDKSRWHTAQGPKHYPYVRTLGGVSLFDFTGFDPDEYSKSYVASWYTFVPLNELEGNKVWIELDRSAVRDALIDGEALLKKWKEDAAYGHNIMPLIEVAHIGPVETTKFTRVLHHLNGAWCQVL